jgi:hypothetical protein
MKRKKKINKEFSLLPPDIKEQTVNEFIKSAGKTETEIVEDRVNKTYPWELLDNNKTRRIITTVRIKEPMHLMIKWLANLEESSLHNIIERHLYSSIKKTIKKKINRE